MSPERKSFRPLGQQDEIFPKTQLEAIKKRGNQLLSPFWVLGKFEISFGNDYRQIALANLLQSNYGNEIRLVETKRGIRIFACDIDPLIKAADSDLGALLLDYGTKKFRIATRRAKL